MKIYKEAIPKAALTVAFAIAVFIFYATIYRNHLHYYEQYQLFMYTADYACATLSYPGGLTDYISRFLVQFFFVTGWGAAIMAVLLAFLQLTTACAMRSGTIVRYVISFLPSIVMWMAMCDENCMPSTCISLIVLNIGVALSIRITGNVARIVTIAVLIPILYMMAGPLVITYAIITAVYEVVVRKERVRFAIAAILVLEAVACPFIAQYFFPYPVYRLFQGIGYFRYPFVFPSMVWATAACLVIVVGISYMKASKYRHHQWIYDVVAVTIVAISGCLGIRTSINMDKEEVFGYDYMARQRQWSEIVNHAMTKHPDKPLSVAVLNLALAKSGALGDHMFRFYQNGTEGLIPKFERDLTMPLVSAEILYNLGMVNSAQRFTYEAQEAIPDHQKSSRCYKRLAETHIINGDYEAARKYLYALQKTLIFKDWATQTLNLLDDEDAINSHPEYGYLRQMRYKTDLFFSEDEMDSMLGILFLDGGNNRMAFEYLLAWSLLNRDLDRFYECYVLGKDLGYDHIPTSYQEALALKWTMSHDSWQGLPWSLSPGVMQRMEQYIYDKRQNIQGISQKYAGTYWDYYFR